MQKLFGFDGPVSIFFEKVANLLWLNILWLICCLPIVTIGVSTSAMYYVTLKMVKNEESYITKSFFKAFKQNFKQATIIWLIFIVFGAVLAVDSYILGANPEGIAKYVHIAICGIGFVFLMTSVYVFPLVAKFENTTANTLKNALGLSIINAPYTLAIVAIIVIPFVLAYFYTIIMPIVLLIGVATIAYFTSKIYNKIFDKLIAQEAAKATEESALE